MQLRRLLTLAGGGALLYSLIEPWRLEVRRFDIYLPDLPLEAEGMRVLQISDLHAGLITPLPLVRRLIATCQRENPDLIALTGDMVSRYGSYSRLVGKLARPVMDYALGLAEELDVLRPPLGMWAIPGNHDQWERSFEPMAEVLGESGIQSLVNRALRLPNGLVLAGLDDLRAGYPDVSGTFAGIDAGQAQLILNHNPRAAMLLANRNALILSGHTHGGQIRLPGLEVRKFPVDLGRNFYVDGFYHLDRAQLYVSRGAGTVHLPMRFFTRPEIAIFTLKRP
jgi:predicted MPP superfamily phosphohydrolase